MAKIRTIVVGTGGMAGHHMRLMLKNRSTQLQAFVEVSQASRRRTKKMLAENGLSDCPPFYNSIADLLAKEKQTPEAALIVTPHKFHLENASDCLKAGIDVLLEKPMVLTAAEARKLIALTNKTGKLLVVAFPGSLSPGVHKAKELIAEGAIGELKGVSGLAHQHWRNNTMGTWRQDPVLSGGGFLFDTGSHMINTMVDIIGEDVTELMAILDNRGTPVEIDAAIAGRFSSGKLFSLSGLGDTYGCKSQIRIYGAEGCIDVGMWGEYLMMQNKGGPFKKVPFGKARQAWEQFVAVRKGKLENPCPPEVGLRFAKLMDLIRASAKSGKRVTAR